MSFPCKYKRCKRGPFDSANALKMHVARAHKGMGPGWGPYAKGGIWRSGGRKPTDGKPHYTLADELPRVTMANSVSLQDAIHALEAKRDVLNDIIIDLKEMNK